MTKSLVTFSLYFFKLLNQLINDCNVTGKHHYASYSYISSKTKIIDNYCPQITRFMININEERELNEEGSHIYLMIANIVYI